MPRHTIHDLPTPALLLDAAVLERNVKTMAGTARSFGVRLRPHVKTHKCLEIGRLQARHGAQGITVATMVEARDFAAGGFDDITWAVPVPASRIGEVVALARSITLRVLVDSLPAAEALEAAAARAGLRLHVFLEVDSGDHRTGVAPDHPDSAALASRLAASSALIFDGLLTHGGHSYAEKDDAGRARVVEQERGLTVGFAERLRTSGLAVGDVSIGSTPGMSAARSLPGVTEVRPGNYVFHDFVQVAAGVCAAADVAVSVLATVISHQPGARHCVVDAGALAMSKDMGPGARGLGPLYRTLSGPELEPAVNLARVSQEHGFVQGADAADIESRFRVGDRVRIMPNHSCLTAAMFDAYHVVDGEHVLDTLPISRGR